jgi:hypothetical protein
MLIDTFSAGAQLFPSGGGRRDSLWHLRNSVRVHVLIHGAMNERFCRFKMHLAGVLLCTERHGVL